MSAPSGGSLAVTATAVALGGARTVPVTWLVTPLGGALLPPPVRVGFGLLLAALASPALVAGAARAGLDRAGPLLLALQLARELAVGLSMGLVASLAFRAAEAAGRLADTARGANLAEVLLPTADQRSSPLGALYMLLGTLVFLELGGVPRVLDALARSYEALPIGGNVTPAGAARVAGVVTLASARLIESAVALAAPVIVALWLTDLTLGLVARAAPQIPVYFLGLPLKGLLAVGVVLAGLAGLEAALARGLPGWMSVLARTIEALP